MVKLIITGAAGRVGTALIKCALEDTDFEIAGLVETKTHPDIGKPCAIMASKTDKPLLIEDSLEKVIEKGDVVIDFTEAKASMEHFRIAKQHGKAHIIGTTGVERWCPCGDTQRKGHESGYFTEYEYWYECPL